MLDINKNVVAELEKILPTHYELFCDNKTTLPCITYREQDNRDRERAESFGYSEISLYVKVWGYFYKDIESYALQVADVMREMGFERVSTNDLIVENQICKVMLYRARGLENYT